MGRYLRVYRTFFLSSLKRELEYRANFLAKAVLNAVWVSFFIMILLVVYSNTKTIAGWNQSQSLILASTVFFMESIMRGFFTSIAEIPTMSRMGTLDFILTKPIDSQFWASTRKFSLEQVGTMLAGAAMIGLGAFQSEIKGDPMAWVGYLTLLTCALVIFYSFTFALMTLGIYWVRVENLWILSESTLDVARYPIDIYSLGVRRVLTYVAPLAFISTMPTSQLIYGFDPEMAGLGILWAVVFFVGARLFWKRATRHYSSASS